MPAIIVASSDADYYLLVSHILREAGFSVILASTVEELLLHAEQSKPTAIVLDCRSGDDLALQACAELKRSPTTFNIPIVALIGPGAAQQYLGLMQAGIDESFVRPITPSKLIAFLQRLSGLPTRQGGAGHAVVTYADIKMDLEAHRVTRDALPIHLGPIEFRILRHLIEHAGHVCSRDALVKAAWQQGRFVDRRTVNVHIGRLRQALGETGGDLIKTVRSAGYVLEEASSDAA